MMSGPAPIDVGCTLRAGRRISISQRRSGTSQRFRRWGRALSVIDAAGHVARDCATSPGKPKGKGKDTYGGNYKGADQQGKSKGNSNGSDSKGKGKGYQGACRECGIVGHNAHECTNPGQYPCYQRQANNIEECIGSMWMHGNVVAEEWVEVPPGLGKRCTRSARSTRTGTSVSNRYELLADHFDSGPWELTSAGNSDDEETVNVVTVRENGTQRETFAKGVWKLHRKVDVGVGTLELGIGRAKYRERGMRFNVARVQKPLEKLASAAKVVGAGNEISNGRRDDNYTMNDATAEGIALRIDRGTCVFDVEFSGW